MASTGWTVNSVKVLTDADSGALVRNRANSASIVSSEKSRVQTRRYARLAIWVGTLALYRGVASQANEARGVARSSSRVRPGASASIYRDGLRIDFSVSFFKKTSTSGRSRPRPRIRVRRRNRQTPRNLLQSFLQGFADSREHLSAGLTQLFFRTSGNAGYHFP